VPHQLVAVEVAGLTVIAALQLLQLLSHGMQYGVVLVQLNLSDLEKILRRLILLCLVLRLSAAVAFDLFTVLMRQRPGSLAPSAAKAIPG
jgi:hypothetical protein